VEAVKYPHFLLMILSFCRQYGVMKLLLAIFFFTIPEAYGQKISFAHLNAEDGLSQNSVLAITQDHQGFIWFGTRSGLNRYDSKRFVTYRANAAQKGSLSNNYILSLLADSRKNLWVGTRNGVNRYRPEDDSFEKIGFEKEPGKEVYINYLFEDSKKRIWATTSNSIYVINDTQKPVLHSFAPLANRQLGIVYVVFEDSNSNIWIGAAGGLFKLTSNGNSFDVRMYRHDAKEINGLADHSITSITEDRKNQLWIGTVNGGLHLYDSEKDRFVHFKHSGANSLINDHIRKLLPDNQNRLWIGTQEGLSVLDINTLRFENFTNEPGKQESLSQNSIHSLFMDNAGTVWVGTFFGGVNSYSPYFNHFSVYNNNSDSFRLNNNVISSIVEDHKGNILIGTEGGGLNYCDTKTGKVSYFTNDAARPGSLGSNLVKVIYKDRQNDIWIGTHGGGLNRVKYEDRGISFTRYSYDAIHGDAPGFEISAIVQDHRGILWVGTERKGVRPFIKTGHKLVQDTGFDKALQPLRNASVGCLLETSSNVLWLGTTDGVYELNGLILKKITGTNGLTVNCIFEDAAKNIWIGTANNGLVCFDINGNRLNTYTAKDGLSQDNVLGILQDRGGNLWISTGNGLVRMSADRSFKTINRHDGLAGNTFNNNSYYRDAAGKMFFGGYDGLVSFNPDEIKENKQPGPVYITGIHFPGKDNENGESEQGYKSILQQKRLVLEHSQNVFTLDFALLSYIKPGKNGYAYKLDGYDEMWKYTTEPSAVYTNVTPGEYIFWCKGSNNDGVWGEPVSLQIRITPPFWKTWWAYSIYAVLFAGLVFFVTYHFYLRALYKRNNELTQLKLDFFTNISHEIRTHLSLIIAPAEKLIRVAENRSHNTQEVQTIKSNSESLLQLVNELMDFRKAETGHLPLHVTENDITSFVNQVYTPFTEIAGIKNITAKLNASTKEIAVWFDKEQMQKVLYNLLSNAFKFTPDGGLIEVALQENAASVIIQVTNNGKGIAKENLDKLFDNYFQENDYGQRNTGYGIGLALSKSIVELHKGIIRVSSQVQEHDEDYLTIFTVELLKGNKHFTREQLTAYSKPEPVINFSQTAIPMQVNEMPLKNEDATGGKSTLLIVEDNQSIRTFIKDILQNEYNILESADGQVGWELATEHIPDLIISDIMMPVMDGFTFCEKLKTDIRTSHIPVILLTAKTSVANQVSGLQAGADVYLTKPFSIEVLELQVRNLLASKERIRKQFSTLLSMPEKTPEMNAVNGIEEQKPALHPLDEAFLNELIRLVEDNIEKTDFGVAMLSKLVAMSQPVLLKKIKAITGMSANDFVKSLRLKKACRLLLENRYTVYEVAFMVGYENSKYFSREFKKEFGKTPTEFASNGLEP
jgi:ligand-binding sensor domain-containing protein/signal transduction histidine kinase/CheY-like chemotaxis protein